MKQVVLLDVDCTLVSADCNQLRPGIPLLCSVLIKLGYELRAWSAAGKEHAEDMVRKFELPMVACHLKPRAVLDILYELPPDATVAMTIDDSPEGRFPGAPFLLVDSFLAPGRYQPE